MLSISKSTALNVTAKAVRKKEICRHAASYGLQKQLRDRWNQQTFVLQAQGTVQSQNELLVSYPIPLETAKAKAGQLLDSDIIQRIQNILCYGRSVKNDFVRSLNEWTSKRCEQRGSTNNMLEDKRNWSEVDSEPTEIHSGSQSKGDTSTSTSTSNESAELLKGFLIARRAVTKRTLTATQRKQQRQQERQLRQQGFEKAEIDDVLGFLDWLNEDEDEEHEKDMKEWFPVTDESEPFRLSILAQKAIKAEAGRML